MLTARAATSSTAATEIIDSTAISDFAQRVRGIASVRAERDPIGQGDLDVVLETRIPGLGRERPIPVLRE
jgi:hypothetical protein